MTMITSPSSGVAAIAICYTAGIAPNPTRFLEAEAMKRRIFLSAAVVVALAELPGPRLPIRRA